MATRRIGIALTKFGYRAAVRVNGHLYTKRFPPTASVTEMQDWRAAARVDALRRDAKRGRVPGQLAADVRAYLAAVRAMPTYRWREDDLAAWIAALGPDWDRHKPNASEDIRRVLHEWRLRGRQNGQPLSESACNHRRTALMHLYSVLDGKAAHNPVRDVPRFREPDPQPRGVPLATIQRILDAMPDSATKARCSVMAWTGLPPSTLMQLTAENVRWNEGTVYVPRRRKGAGTKARVLPLLPQALAAFRLMEKHKAWGPFSRDALRMSLHRACVAAEVPNIRPYDLRHSFGTAAYQVTGDILAVQTLLDHADAKLTARYTLGAVDTRIRSALGKLEKVATEVTTSKKPRRTR